MNIICKLIGHNYAQNASTTEKPYTGPYEVNGKKPHTLILTMVFCKRCLHMDYIRNYLTGYDKENK